MRAFRLVSLAAITLLGMTACTSRQVASPPKPSAPATAVFWIAPGDTGAGSAPASLQFLDLASGRIVRSMPISGAVAPSDVSAITGRPTLLVTEPGTVRELDLAAGSARTVATLTPASATGSAPRPAFQAADAQYGRDGSIVMAGFSGSAVGAMRIDRATGRFTYAALPPKPDVGQHEQLYIVSAAATEAHVFEEVWPANRRGLGPVTRPLRADFSRATVEAAGPGVLWGRGGGGTFPSGIALERVFRRWGVPVPAPRQRIRFRMPPSSAETSPTQLHWPHWGAESSNDLPYIQPGGETFLTFSEDPSNGSLVLGAAEHTVIPEDFKGHTVWTRGVRTPLDRPLEPVGLLPDGSFVYLATPGQDPREHVNQQGVAPHALGAAVVPSYDPRVPLLLMRHDPRSGEDTRVAELPWHDHLGAVRYLGSY